MRPWVAGGLCAGAVLGSAKWFLRDPERHPGDAVGVALAAADGRILEIAPASRGRHAHPPGARVGRDDWRLVIFLSLWDVHVQRAPVAGTVTAAFHHPGPRWPALLPGSTRNAGHWIELRGSTGRVCIHRTAGIVARRVTSAVTPGDRIAAGDRIGRIVLGSRTALYLPSQWVPVVKVGARVRAGETVVARLRDTAGGGRSEGRVGPGPRP